MWVWTKQFLRELKTASSLLGWGAKVHISSSANEQSCKLIRALNNSVLEAKLCCRGGRPKGSGLEPHPSAGRWKILPRAPLMFSSRMGTRNNHGVLLSDISTCASQGTGGGFWFPPHHGIDFPLPAPQQPPEQPFPRRAGCKGAPCDLRLG